MKWQLIDVDYRSDDIVKQNIGGRFVWIMLLVFIRLNIKIDLIANEIFVQRDDENDLNIWLNWKKKTNDVYLFEEHWIFECNDWAS